MPSRPGLENGEMQLNHKKMHVSLRQSACNGTGVVNVVYESLLDKIREEKKIRCPDCGSGNMKYMPHLNMYGGYVCSGCSKIWDSKDAKIKEQKKRLI